MINSKFHSDNIRSGKTHELQYTWTTFKKKIISVPERRINYSILISDSNSKTKIPNIIFQLKLYSQSPLEGMEANHDCTILWYQKSMWGVEMTKFSH